MQTSILVVEDDPLLREVIRLTLEEFGYRTLLACNGQGALEVLAQDSSVIAITLDLEMPFLSGWEFLSIKNQNPRFAKIPVVVVSATIPTDLSGVAAFIQKPFKISELIQAIEACRSSSI